MMDNLDNFPLGSRHVLEYELGHALVAQLRRLTDDAVELNAIKRLETFHGTPDDMQTAATIFERNDLRAFADHVRAAIAY